MKKIVAFAFVLIFVVSLLATCFASPGYRRVCRCGYSYCNAPATRVYGPWQDTHVWVNHPNGGWWAKRQRTVKITCTKGHIYRDWDYE